MPLVPRCRWSPGAVVCSYCLLSDKEISMDLHGYCDLGSMLQYRLDKDVALVGRCFIDSLIAGFH